MKGRKIPVFLKRKVMNTVILPAITNGAETWTLTKHQEKLVVAQRSMEIVVEHHTERKDPE